MEGIIATKCTIVFCVPHFYEVGDVLYSSCRETKLRLLLGVGTRSSRYRIFNKSYGCSMIFCLTLTTVWLIFGRYLEADRSPNLLGTHW